MLLRLAYLGLTNTFALIRLLPMSNRDKDIEILSLRHQVAVLQRQLGDTRVPFSPADRANTNASITRTGPTKASPTPDHSDCCHRRSSTRPRSTVSTSANTHVWAAYSTNTTTPPDQRG